jgi:signal transduction histidine kinase
VAFVLFVFLMASSVLVAGAAWRLVNGWLFVCLLAVPTGQGLRSMRERASRVGGLLEVGPGARDAGRGTRVRARLPLQALGNG